MNVATTLVNPTAAHHSPLGVPGCGAESHSDVKMGQDELARWFTQEVKPHESHLRSWLRARFPALTDIDDLISDTFARVLAVRRSGKIVITNTRPYLFVTAANAARDIYRRRQILTIEPLANPAGLSVVEDGPSIPETVSHEEELSLLTDAIRALPERCRQIVTLRKLHELTHRQIADKLGISENTVSAQLSLGTFKIRDYLVAHGVSRIRLRTNSD